MGLCKLKTQQNFHQSLQLLHFTKQYIMFQLIASILLQL